MQLISIRIQSVIAILEDEAVDEEDRPEMLKELLSSLLVSPDAVNIITSPRLRSDADIVCLL